MVLKDYSKSRMRENRTYGSVRGGRGNSTRLLDTVIVVTTHIGFHDIYNILQ